MSAAWPIDGTGLQSAARIAPARPRVLPGSSETDDRPVQRTVGRTSVLGLHLGRASGLLLHAQQCRRDPCRVLCLEIATPTATTNPLGEQAFAADRQAVSSSPSWRSFDVEAVANSRQRHGRLIPVRMRSV